MFRYMYTAQTDQVWQMSRLSESLCDVHVLVTGLICTGSNILTPLVHNIHVLDPTPPGQDVHTLYFMMLIIIACYNKHSIYYIDTVYTIIKYNV